MRRLAALACGLGLHDWGRHPGFVVADVRRCGSCGRVEGRGTGRRWRRLPWIEAEDRGELELRAGR